MRTAAVLPIKRFDAAKQRLDPVVERPLRAELAHAMAADVLDSLKCCAAIERVFLVTAERRARALAGSTGAVVVEDTVQGGQSSAVRIGIRAALAEDFTRVLCVPGDCPALDVSELDTLLRSESPREVVIVPDRHGTGTNALLLSPPTVIEPSFGPDSFARHGQLADARGVPPSVQRPPSLLLDVDTGADLEALREHLESIAAAPRTRALLGERLAVG